MKRILSFCLLLLIALAAQAQDTKYTVTLNVPEDGTLSAYAGIKSGDYISRRSEFAAGEEVHLTGSLKAEYSSTGWTDEQGRQVCDSLHYIFTMPAHNIVLTAHTTYDPANPPGPREDGYTDTWNRLYLRSNPEFGGTFTWGLGGEASQNWLVWTGYEFTVTAYPKTGFKFAGWQLDGKMVSTDNPYTFTMPERDMTLYAMYDYDPETPANPHGNVWNKESGELIISEFVPGHLYEKVREVTSRDPWHSDWDLIKSATIDGPSTDASLTYDYPIDISVFTNNAGNVEFIDYSRTSGITKVPRGCFSKKSLKQVVLPASIQTIGEYAFRNCESLTTVTCFATTPPTFKGRMPGEQGYSANDYYNNWAFDGLNKDNIIVHVPAETVPLYQQARGWKEFMILPITTGVQRLTVTLPSSGDYKDMFLELVNTKTLQSQRYVITNATSYTFNNLIRNTQHALYLKNQRGDVLGTIEGIDIQDKDLQVSFADLKTPIDVALRLLLPDGTALPSLGEGSGVGLTWTDRQGNYLATGATLTGQLEGAQVIAKVKLDEALGRQYQNPADTLFEVKANTPLNISLTPFTAVELTGTVTAESTGKPVRGATVTVSQTLNGQYTVTQTAKTDIDGHYALTVYDAPTTITVTHSSFLKATLVTDNLPSLGEGPGVGFALRDLTGTIIDLDLSYTAAVADGEEVVTEEGYGAPENIAYTVYDETHGKELTDISSQYPILVLLGDELAEGSRLRITATSITGDFMPVTTTCTVDSNARATAIFGIKEMGQLKATFEMTDNMQVMGVLYHGNGQLAGWAPYKDTELMATHLKDGNYTLVTMGYSELFTSVSSLDDLLSLHGMDEQQLVKNEVSISSGHITEVKNGSVPLLDEDRFRYTSDATNVSVNKSEVTVGSYVTVRAELGFKPAYVDALSKVRLQFDLPEGCEYVDGSMMVGNKTTACEQDDRRITVLVEDLNEAVRFCVVPTQGGLHEISAGTRFRINGATTIQPIGAVTFSAADLTINVPETVGSRLVPVTGMAVPLSQVEVYDGDVSIGQTTAIGTGFWSVACPLNGSYNLLEHNIYAVVTTPEGLQIQSETQTVTVNRSNLTPVLTMHMQTKDREHSHFDINVDYRTMTCDQKYIQQRYLGDCSFSFKVNFYDSGDLLANDTTVISNVVVYTLNERRNIERHETHYSKRYKCWYVELENVDYWNLPVYYEVTYDVLRDAALDRDMMDDMLADLEAAYEENRQQMKNLFAAFDEDGELPHSEEYAELDNLIELDAHTPEQRQRIEELLRIIAGDELVDEVLQEQVDFSEVEALQAQLDPQNPDAELLSQIHEIVFALQDEIITRSDARRAEFEATMQSIKLEQSNYQNQLLALRDSMEVLMSYYMQVDTTALQKPVGDTSFDIAAGDMTRFYEMRHLSTIDPKQLLADGYEEMPMTDGTIIYTRKDENGFSLIDTHTGTLYQMKADGPASYDNAMAAKARRVVTMNKRRFMLFDQDCLDDALYNFKDFWKHYEQLKQAGGDSWAQFSANSANICTYMKKTVDILACLYESGWKNSYQFFLDLFAKHGKEAQDLKKMTERWEKETQRMVVRQNLTVGQLEKAGEQLQKDMMSFGQLLSSTSDPDIKKGFQQSIEQTKNKIIENTTKLNQEKELLKLHEGNLKTIQKELSETERVVLAILTQKTELIKLYKKYPSKFQGALKLGRGIINTTGWVAKFTGTVIGTFLQLVPLAMLIYDNTADALAWVDLGKEVDAYLPCEGDKAKWQQIHDRFVEYGKHHTLVDIGQVCNDAVSMCLDVTDVPVFSFQWWLSTLMDVGSLCVAVSHPNCSSLQRDGIRLSLRTLDCNKKPESEDTIDIIKPKPPKSFNEGEKRRLDEAYYHGYYNLDQLILFYYILGVIRDPAGYVYEAVNSNRVEGVRTTCYYKETKEDMYGDLHDEAVVWDAETYAQENPLFTDADGRYQWDVPTGLWQVKYEKQGYETTYSDWLPVPPPQLEVNVGITQLKQPNVQKVKAYENGIDITFDKYMRPHTIASPNPSEGGERVPPSPNPSQGGELAGATTVVVTKDGQVVPGTIELLNAESGYQTPDSVYASKVRFVPGSANLNVNDKVQLTVRRAVESYAGVPMEQDFTQQFTVEQRIEALVADSALNLQEGKEQTLTVRAVPAAAAKGKKVKVTTSDAEVISLPSLGEGSEVGFDQNGEAKVSLSALGEGSSIVRFTLADEDELTTTTLVTVRNQQQMQVSAPRSSKLNGVTLYIGSEIRLSSATGGATILYTLDGSCPCAPESGKVLTYTGPIVMSGERMTIKAMAVAPGMEDSPVVEFSYKGIQRPTAIEAPTVSDDSPVGEQPKLFFRLNGQRITQPERGITIERQRNGTVQKVLVR